MESGICLDELSKLLKINKSDLISFLSNKNSIANIYIDGGARGNPGESGIGIVIKNTDNKKGYYFYTGYSTNNEAEYKALIKALTIAKENGIKDVKIFSDSELVCNQINGLYKVKSEGLIELNLEAKRLQNSFNSFSIKHVPREQNKEADKMVNLAIDLKNEGVVELTVAGQFIYPEESPGSIGHNAG